MANDRLSEIFQSFLRETDDLSESASTLIRRVAGAYAEELLESGSIPLQFLDDVLHDLEHEILEMYRKTTYGFLSLQEYREQRLAPKQRC